MPAVAVETDATGARVEQRVVAADADVFSGEMLGAALAHDDGAGFDKLLAAALEAEALWPSRPFLEELILFYVP